MPRRAPVSAEERAQAAVELRARLGLPATLQLAEQAFVHPSYSNEQLEARGRDNQRLEFLGDAVLGLCVSELLMTLFADRDEGQLTVMRAALVNASSLASVARGLGVADALLLGRGADTAGERHRTNVLADALEALVGAVYLELGLDAARTLSRKLLGDRLEELRLAGGVARDPKSRLQEQLQAQGRPAPRYDLVAAIGPAHARAFDVRVILEGFGPEPVVAGRGQGRSKKLAEQAAAEQALGWLRESEPPPGA